MTTGAKLLIPLSNINDVTFPMCNAGQEENVELISSKSNI